MFFLLPLLAMVRSTILNNYYCIDLLIVSFTFFISNKRDLLNFILNYSFYFCFLLVFFVFRLLYQRFFTIDALTLYCLCLILMTSFSDSWKYKQTIKISLLLCIFLNIIFIINENYSFYNDKAMTYYLNSDKSRLGGLFVDPNFFAIIFVWLSYYLSPTPIRSFYILIGYLITKSKTLLISFLIAMITNPFLRVIGLFIGGIYLLENYKDIDTLSFRIALLEEVFDNIKIFDILVGADSNSLSLEIQKSIGYTGSNYHNGYLQIILLLGLLSVPLFYFIFKLAYEHKKMLMRDNSFVFIYLLIFPLTYNSFALIPFAMLLGGVISNNLENFRILNLELKWSSPKC